jgi:hypothetical protein
MTSNRTVDPVPELQCLTRSETLAKTNAALSHTRADTETPPRGPAIAKRRERLRLPGRHLFDLYPPRSRSMKRDPAVKHGFSTCTRCDLRADPCRLGRR